MTPAIRYEVQFRDGDGAWRRWSTTATRDRAEKSLERINSLLGEPLVRLGWTRIVLRDAQ